MKFLQKLFAPLIRKIKKGTHKERVVCNTCGRVWNAVWFDPMTVEELTCPNCGEKGARVF